MYSAKVMEYFMMPRNAWYMADADGVGCEYDAECGDKFTMFIRVNGENIRDISFLGFGCGAAIAAGSLTTMLAKGKSIRDALQITEEEIMDALGGLPEEKRHCSDLSVSALQSAILDYLAKQGRSIKEYLS
jgi:nitrogen fixation NifU-like protein